MLLFALWRCEALALPLNPRFTAQETQAIFHEQGCQYLISPPQSRPRAHLSWLSISELVERPQRVQTRPYWPAETQPVTLILTSGSTGRAKAALHTWQAHLWSAKGAAENMPFTRDDRWLLSLPLYHVGGLAIVFRCLLAQGSLLLASSLKAGISTQEPTHISLVATQLYRLLEQNIPPPPSLKALLLGGSALPAPLLKLAWKQQWPLYTSYGSTEMASQVTTTPPGSALTTLYSSGQLLPYRELQIRNQEIWVRGQTLFKGYRYAHDDFRKPFDSDGWFATGDLGQFNAQGMLEVKGRKDHMFVSGGENIYPEEIERILEAHPQIFRARVIPFIHEEFGERPAAIIDINPNQNLELKQVKSFLNAQLARFKCPDQFYYWPHPKGPIPLKINREYLKDLLQNRQLRLIN